MTRRLRTDRMLRRVREERAVELLRASGEEVAARVSQGCKPECPTGFHYHTAFGVTHEMTVAAYERGNWVPQGTPAVDATGFEPARMSISDLFYNPDLLGTTNEPWPPHGWIKSLARRITRRNGDPTP